MDNPWKGPTQEGDLTPNPTLKGPDVTDPVAVARETLRDLMDHPVGYLLAGLTYFAAVFGLIIASMLALGVCMAPGLALEDETLITIGGIIGGLIYTTLIIAFTLVGYPLMTASLMLNLRDQRSGGAQIGISSTFNRMTERMGPAIRMYLLTQLLVLVGMVFLYIPGLIAMVVCTFAFPIVIFEDVSATEALKLSWAHIQKNAGWHVAVVFVAIALFIVIELTVVGIFVLWPLMACYQLVAYEKAFGSGGAAHLSA